MTEIARILAGNINTQTSLKRAIVTKSNIQNRIQIGSGVVNLIDMPEVWENRNIYSGTSDSFILGHPVNGIMGAPQLGAGGNQVVLGNFGTAFAVRRIVNPPNSGGTGRVWRWMLSSLENTYWNSGSTTATVSSGSVISFTAGQSFRSNTLSTESGTIRTATLGINTDNIINSANLTYYLSTDDGMTWDSATVGTARTLSSPGYNLRFRVDASASASIFLKDRTSLIRTPIEIEYIPD